MDQCSDKDYRRLPSVTAVLTHAAVAGFVETYGRSVVIHAVRTVLEEARVRIRQGMGEECGVDAVATKALGLASAICCPSLKRVVNATGVVLHTNLGRSPLAPGVASSIADLAVGYTNLEFDLARGRRGRRGTHVRDLLRFVTSAEDAVVVNNNAAGIFLALSTLAGGREVVVSRGELIEIGGSFRLPEIMAASGARMVEVGTTNRTRVSDYEAAIGPETALLFKAHRSNFAITGFSEEVPAQDLAELAHAHELPMVYDVGSGLLQQLPGLPVRSEPDVRTALSEGADLVLFSCDKLLGGPQAGVAVGRADLVTRLAEAPLMRALRVGKLTLAGLCAVCRSYLKPDECLSANPVLAMLARSREDLVRLATLLRTELGKHGVSASLADSIGKPGGGSMPEVRLPSVALEVPPQGQHATACGSTFAEYLFAGLLQQEPPVLAVLREGKLYLDVLALSEHEVPEVAAAVARVIDSEATP